MPSIAPLQKLVDQLHVQSLEGNSIIYSLKCYLGLEFASN